MEEKGFNHDKKIETVAPAYYQHNNSYIVSRFQQLIPDTLSDEHKSDKVVSAAFVRERKLTLPKLVSFVLSSTATGKTQGIDGKLGQFLKQARRCNLWDKEAESMDRSAITKARAKVSYILFESMLKEAVELAYSLLSNSDDYLWNDYTAIAFDGPKYDLPATPAIRDKFDPKSGLGVSGKGHYPQ